MLVLVLLPNQALPIHHDGMAWWQHLLLGFKANRWASALLQFWAMGEALDTNHIYVTCVIILTHTSPNLLPFAQPLILHSPILLHAIALTQQLRPVA